MGSAARIDTVILFIALNLFHLCLEIFPHLGSRHLTVNFVFVDFSCFMETALTLVKCIIITSLSNIREGKWAPEIIYLISY